MQDEWYDADAEAKEQDLQDRWALRILTCPKGACRRKRSCFGYAAGKCPGVAAYPFTEEEAGWRLRQLKRHVELSLAEHRAGDAAARAARIARHAEAHARRTALAFERASETLKNRGDERADARRSSGRAPSPDHPSGGVG